MVFFDPARFLLSGVLVASAAPLALTQSANGVVPAPLPDTQISGVWRGHSDCVVRNSPCRDEVNVYRFSPLPHKPGSFLGAGSKVVDGKEVSMGDLEWAYKPQTQTLESETPRGSFRLVLNGNQIEGSLTLPDHTLYRRIYLKKEN